MSLVIVHFFHKKSKPEDLPYIRRSSGLMSACVYPVRPGSGWMTPR